MTSGAPLASSSSVAGTAPSTEFSSGTSAPSTVPARTASIASVTLGMGSSVAAVGRVEQPQRRRARTCPRDRGRRARVTAPSSRVLLSWPCGAPAGRAGRSQRGGDRLLLLRRQIVLALAAADALGVDAGVRRCRRSR